MLKSPDPSPHSCPDLVPVITTIGVDPEIATTTTRLRTFLHYVHVHARKVVCDNTESGVCYMLCCMNILSMLISSNYQLSCIAATQIYGYIITQNIATQHINNNN